MQTFRDIVYAAGITGAQIERKLGFSKGYVGERLRSRRQFKYAEIEAIAAMAGKPAVELYELHVKEFYEGGLAEDRRKINPLWTPEQDALLRDYAARGLTIPAAAKALGRSYPATYGRAVKLRLNFVRADKGEAREMMQHGYDAAQPIQKADEDAIAALYAKHGRYQDVTFRREGSTGRAPIRPDRITVTGSTGQMCVEAAR